MEFGRITVALANKNARILWALMTHERSYELSPHAASFGDESNMPDMKSKMQ